MKIASKIALVSALIVSALLCQSCSGSLVNLKYKDGEFVNRRLGLRYVAASTSYQPVAIGEAYGYYGKLDMTLYEIAGLDPKEWLTEEDSGSATTIFHAADIELPTLSEMEPDKVYVCLNGDYTFVATTIEEQTVIDSLIDLFENGEGEEWPLVNSSVVYHLKFHSEENFPHLYYNLIYGEFEEGNFIYERSTRRCVNVGTLISDLVS